MQKINTFGDFIQIVAYRSKLMVLIVRESGDIPATGVWKQNEFC